MGALQNALPERVSPEVEEAVLDIIKLRTAFPVSMFVAAVRAAEAVGGPEAREAIRKADYEGAIAWAREWGESVEDNSLRVFCESMEEGCLGANEWEKLENTDTRQAYRFSRCLWAEAFRELDAADIGCWICERDADVAAAFNPAIRFTRTKTLMEGDDCCDHVYWIEE
jgi:hypothetical protein